MLAAPASQLQFVITREARVDVARVFDVLISEAGMRAWVPQCRRAVWQHPPGATKPCVGSVRNIVLKGGVIASERIIVWEAGRELHYCFDETSLPIAAFTRNYVGVTRVEPVGPGRTRLIWAIHYDAPGALALIAPAMRFSLRLLIAAMASKLMRAALTGK